MQPSIKGASVSLVVACWTTDHYHPCSNPDVGISEACFVFHFVSLPLEVARPILPTLCTKVAVKRQSSSATIRKINSCYFQAASWESLLLVFVDYETFFHLSTTVSWNTSVSQKLFEELMAEPLAYLMYL